MSQSSFEIHEQSSADQNNSRPSREIGVACLCNGKQTYEVNKTYSCLRPTPGGNRPCSKSPPWRIRLSNLAASGWLAVISLHEPRYYSSLDPIISLNFCLICLLPRAPQFFCDPLFSRYTWIANHHIACHGFHTTCFS